MNHRNHSDGIGNTDTVREIITPFFPTLNWRIGPAAMPVFVSLLIQSPSIMLGVVGVSVVLGVDVGVGVSVVVGGVVVGGVVTGGVVVGGVVTGGVVVGDVVVDAEAQPPKIGATTTSITTAIIKSLFIFPLPHELFN
jgi:hypothetical protein